MIGAVAALVVYYGAQSGTWGVWWWGQYESSRLWIACIGVMLIVAFFSALISVRRN